MDSAAISVSAVDTMRGSPSSRKHVTLPSSTKQPSRWWSWISVYA